MEAQEAKLFAQLDSDFPGERSNALELLRDLLRKGNRSFRAIVQEIDQRETELQQYVAANQQAAQRHAVLQAEIVRKDAEIARLRAALARQGGRFYWLRSSVASLLAWWWQSASLKKCTVAAAIVVALYEFPVPVWAYWWAIGRNAAFEALADASVWGQGMSEPRVHAVGDAEYWVVLEGYDATGKYHDADGRALPIRCLTVYATAAERGPIGGFVSPPSEKEAHRSSWNWAAWEWEYSYSMAWPQRADVCKRAADWKQTATVPALPADNLRISAK